VFNSYVNYYNSYIITSVVNLAIKSQGENLAFGFLQDLELVILAENPAPSLGKQGF